jgi:phage terminase small subunit
LAVKKRSGQKKRVKAGTQRKAAQDRRLAFVHAYLTNGQNASQAAITAGFSEKGAGVVGCNLLKDIKIQEIISNAAKKAAEASGLTAERTLKEIARIAYFDSRTLFGDNGKLKSVPTLDDDAAAVLAGLEVTEEFEGRGEDRECIGYTKKVKLCDKNSALDKAAKILALYAAEKVEHSGGIVLLTQEQVDAAREESLKRVGDKAAKKR